MNKPTEHTLEEDFAHYLAYSGLSDASEDDKAKYRKAYEAAWSPRRPHVELDTRAKFEAWAVSKGFNVKPACSDSLDDYAEPETESAWEAWQEQARRALHQQAESARPSNWQECQRISNFPFVDEALRNFIENRTDDSAALIVHSVLQSAGLSERAFVQSAELNYATRLAQAIWHEHYMKHAPEWGPLSDLMGVLSQIDNMVTGMTRLAGTAQIAVPRATLELIYEAMNHMGDQLNEMDVVEEEDEDKCTPAFDAIRDLLAAPSPSAS